jgi:hypothetical protein
MPRIENWACVPGSDDPYLPPERLGISITGNVYARPGFEDGKAIRTSKVVRVQANLVWTKSGTCYELGTPSEEYLTWLKDHGYDYNPSLPIKVKV